MLSDHINNSSSPNREPWSWRNLMVIIDVPAITHLGRLHLQKICTVFPQEALRGHEFCRGPECIGLISFRDTLTTGRRTGRSLPEARETGTTGGGKSELRRAVCRITSGTRASRLVDGQCHRKETASATPLPNGRGPPWKRNTRVGPACRVRSPLRQLQRRGKGEMVR